MALRTPLTAQPHLYIGDSTGRPLDYGRVYFGEPNKDPEFYPIDIYLDPEMTIAAAQPVRTKGGFMDVGGNLAELHAAEVIYSLKVLDRYGRQVFYKPEMYRNNVSDFLVDEITRATAAETLIAGNLTAETQRAVAAEKVIADAVVAEKDRAVAAEDALDAKHAALSSTINSLGGGKKAYTTYALMVADKNNIAANSSIDVTNDTDPLKNGTYSYDGAVFTKSIYDVETIVRTKVLNTFKTKSLMDASALPDGADAQVTDDSVAENNGLYIKTAGAWVKSKYNPEASALNDVISTFGYIVARPEYIDGKAVRPYSATEILTAGTVADRQYLEIDVTGFDSLYITQAKTIAGTADEWRWIAVDGTKSNKLGVSDFNGVGLFKLPVGTAYVIRNSKINANTDNTVKAIKSKDKYVIDELLSSNNANSKSISSLKNDVLLLNRELVVATSPDITVAPATFKIIDGATIMTDVTNIGTKDYLSFGADRDYFSIDLVGASQLVIEKSGFKERGLDILFIDSDDLLISKERSQESGVFDIPKGAVKALRTRKFPPASDYIESDAIEFKLRYNPITYDGLSIAQIKEQVDLNTQRVLSLGKAEADAYDAYDKAQDIIAKSNKPVYKLSDFSGATSQDKIKDALSFIESAGKGILDLESGTHLLEEATVLPSHCWLYLNDSTVKLADGTFDNIIRNKGIVPNPDPFKDSDTINEDRDIRIFGNGNTRSFIEGQDVPKSAPSPLDGSVVTWTDDNFGWRTIGILFANVKDFQMHDFKMQSLHSWAISLGNGCDGFDVGHIEFYNTGTNGDGVHLVNGASNGYIHDLSGRTRDDMVGITATRNFAKEPYPDRQYVYPMAVGGWDYSDNWSIDIHDITIERINCWGGTQAVRILVNNQAKCYNISVNNVVSTSGHVRGMIIGTGWGIDSGWGDIYNIFINNLDVNTASVGLYLDAKIQNLIVNKLTMGKDTAQAIVKTSKFAGQSVKVSNVNAHIGTDV